MPVSHLVAQTLLWGTVPASVQPPVDAASVAVPADQSTPESVAAPVMVDKFGTVHDALQTGVVSQTLITALLHFAVPGVPVYWLAASHSASQTESWVTTPPTVHPPLFQTTPVGVGIFDIASTVHGAWQTGFVDQVVDGKDPSLHAGVKPAVTRV